MRLSSLAAVILAAAVIPGPAPAQWLKLPTPGIPRTADGKPDLSAPAPRKADGTPSLGGIWRVNGKYLTNVAADLKPGEVPFQPWAEAVYKERNESNGKDHPGAQCLPSGIPEKDAVPDPFKIIQNPDLVVVLYESRTIYRQIFTDGRSLPVDPQPSWMGYSVGRWEKDAFVVETAGFNGKSWLDMSGHPATEALRVTERFLRRDVGHMDLQITINDPTGIGATAIANMSPISQVLPAREVYSFSEFDLSVFPGVQSIYAIRSVNILYTNYRYAVRVYDFTTYQAKIRNYSGGSFQYVPVYASQFGRGTDGSLYMYPPPSQAYQVEIDCSCLPQAPLRFSATVLSNCTVRRQVQ